MSLNGKVIKPSQYYVHNSRKSRMDNLGDNFCSRDSCLGHDANLSSTFRNSQSGPRNSSHILWITQFRTEIGTETKNQLVLDSWFETADESVSRFAGSNQAIEKVVSLFISSGQWFEMTGSWLFDSNQYWEKRCFLIIWFETTSENLGFLVHFSKQKQWNWITCFEPIVYLPICDFGFIE